MSKATSRLTAAAAAELAALHARSTIKKGQGHVSPARRQASKRLWELVNQQYAAGVSSAALGHLLGVQAKTVTAQLRSRGFLGGPSPSRKRGPRRGGPGSARAAKPRLVDAAARAQRANEQLVAAKAQAAAARDELRRAVVAEHAASRPVPGSSRCTGVGVKTIRHWLGPAPRKCQLLHRDVSSGCY